MTKIKKIIRLFALVLFVALAAGNFTTDAEAGTMLLGTIGNPNTAVTSTLVEIDPATGDLLRTIGDVGYLINGLAFDFSSNVLYGTVSADACSDDETNYNGLITIDIKTGAGTPVGAQFFGDTDCVMITNLAINSSGEMFAWTELDDDLVSIDEGTGVATVVGDSGLDTRRYGLAFNSSDELYLVNADDFGDPGDMYVISTADGSVLASSPENLGVVAHHGVFDLSTDIYYGVGMDIGMPPASSARTLEICNLSAILVLDSLPTVDNLHTLAFVRKNSGGGGGSSCFIRSSMD